MQNEENKLKAELEYWEYKKKKENILSNKHYKQFYTKNFGLNINFYKGKKILDIGCGPRGSLEWADNASLRIGLDPLVDSYKNLGIAAHKMNYILADAENIPFPDNYFDVVTSFNSLDHVDNLNKTIEEIVRVLAPGGTFLLITEVNHKPTKTEPISFSWDILKKFNLKLIKEKRYEKSPLGIYESLKNEFDMKNKKERAGVLSAILKKGQPKKIQKNPKKLPGTLWGITCLFNPMGYKNRYKNYQMFREKSKKQKLKLLAIELAFENQPFFLKGDDADKLIQLRINKEGIMWQKERLLNIALKHLPKDCDKVAWLDADIIFQDDRWIEKASKLLEDYWTIQPFSYVIRLPEQNPKIIEPEKLREGSSENQRLKGYVCSSLTSSNPIPNMGYAWAARREILDKFGFYDKAIIGGGDRFMAYAFLKDDLKEERIREWLLKSCSKEMLKNYLDWYKKVYKVTCGSSYYLEGYIFHLWHGSQSNRFHGERELIIQNNNFNPKKDIKKNKEGLWVWTLNKSIMQKEVKNYFILRNEDEKINQIFFF